MGSETALLFKAHDFWNGIEYDEEPFDDNRFLEELLDVNDILYHSVLRLVDKHSTDHESGV